MASNAERAVASIGGTIIALYLLASPEGVLDGIAIPKEQVQNVVVLGIGAVLLGLIATSMREDHKLRTA